MKPVILPITFRLDPDGTVYWRRTTGDWRIEKGSDVEALVHEEYQRLAVKARNALKRQAAFARVRALFSKQVDTTKKGA